MYPYSEESILPRYMTVEEYVYSLYQRQRTNTLVLLICVAAYSFPGFLSYIAVQYLLKLFNMNSQNKVSVELFNAYIGERNRVAHERSLQKSKYLEMLNKKP